MIVDESGKKMGVVVPYSNCSRSDSTQEWSVSVFDENLSKTHSTLRLSSEKEVTLGEVQLTVKGELLAVAVQNSLRMNGMNYIGKDGFSVMKNQDVGERFAIIKLAKDGEVVFTKSLGFDMGTKSFNSYKTKLVENDIVVMGFFEDMNAEDLTVLASGTFIYRLNTETGEDSFRTQYFDEGMKDARKENHVNGGILAKEIIEVGDQIILIAENFSYFIEYITEGNTHGNNYRYVNSYNDILVASFQNEGESYWNHRIPRKQITRSDCGNFGSFFLHKHDDDFYLIMNGNDYFFNHEQVGNKKWEIVKATKSKNIVGVRINQNGEYKKITISDSKYSSDNLLKPDSGISYDGKLIFMTRDFPLTTLNKMGLVSLELK
jgi:hypothetical protein